MYARKDGPMNNNLGDLEACAHNEEPKRRPKSPNIYALFGAQSLLMAHLPSDLTLSFSRPSYFLMH